MALTQAQLASHIGTLVVLGVSRTNNPEQREAVQQALIDWAEHYVPNGSFGTQADRLEAMTTLAKRLYEVEVGAHPDSHASHLHRYSAHWLPRRRAGG
jgi:hypothetical protein